MDRMLLPVMYASREGDMFSAWPPAAGSISEFLLEERRRLRAAGSPSILVNGLEIHALLFPDGSAWDVIKGWRRDQSGALIKLEFTNSMSYCPMCNYGWDKYESDSCKRCGWTPQASDADLRRQWEAEETQDRLLRGLKAFRDSYAGQQQAKHQPQTPQAKLTPQAKGGLIACVCGTKNQPWRSHCRLCGMSLGS